MIIVEGVWVVVFFWRNAPRLYQLLLRIANPGIPIIVPKLCF
ncbi:hypothetical protein HNQ92_003929 [Rhabdobacter roseus]|uniref:Uncharacterized protein n=1 Tax=Rhabdobacter roseus TaxID=1655419 RepID=A0A840U1N8_9BACT|nr:hypothetical protein [Rhabdobacter roseus]MBB5285769.1 hypothetical protein [Rhabdobacter roseus]